MKTKNGNILIIALMIFAMTTALFFSPLKKSEAIVIYPASASIAAGDITSTHILNGTITNADIADSGSWSFSTSSPSATLTVWANTDPAFLIANTASTTLLTFTQAGNLGIGTTSPFALLSVAGSGFFNSSLTASNITATGTLTVQSTTATSTFGTGGLTVGTSQFVVQQTSGNIGIGTAEPEQILDVRGIFKLKDVSTTLLLESNANNDHLIDFYETTNIKARIGRDSSVNNLVFQGTAGALGGTNDHLVISGTGNIGIGTTTPASLLNIASTLPRFYLSDTNFATNGHWFLENDAGVFSLGTTSSALVVSATRALTITNVGNVGISTSTPGRLFSVGGAALIGGDLTLTGTCSGCLKNYVSTSSAAITGPTAQGASASANVYCTSPGKLLSGGFVHAPGNLNVVEQRVTENYRVADDQWRATVLCSTASCTGGTITAYALCAEF